MSPYSLNLSTLKLKYSQLCFWVQCAQIGKLGPITPNLGTCKVL